MKTTKINTYLPLFPGFYGTHYEGDEINFLEEEGVDYDDIDVDYEGYQKDVSIEACGYVEENCEFVKSVKFEKLNSPREYNFSNDSIDCEIEIDVDAFYKWLISQEAELDAFLKRRYTSYDGFCSSYSNSYAEWFEETDGFKNLDIDGQRLGSLLDFYFSLEDEAKINMYYHVSERVHIDFYITINHRLIENLADYDKEEVARKIIDTMDEPFGYMELLVNEYKQRAEGTGMDWKDILAEKEYEEIFKASSVTKVNNELELVM